MSSANPSSPSSDPPVVLITGSNGRIGAPLAAALSARYRVVGLDRDRPAAVPAGTGFLQCDLTDPADLERALADLRRTEGDHLASVVHLAAYYDFSGEPSDMYEKLTVNGTQRLLAGLAAFDVEQFVFASTILVMQPSVDEPIDESSPVEAEWDYPQSKLQAESIIQRHSGTIPAVILRIAGVYDDAFHSIPISQQVRRIYEKQIESYFFPGNPDHGQPFIHIEDLTACFERVIAMRGDLGEHEVFLVAEPDIVSYGELQDRIGEKLHGEEWPTIRIPGPLAKAAAWVKDKLPMGEDPFIKPWMVDLADAHYPIAIGAARERLGWQPVHRLRDALDGMLDRMVEDPQRFYAENDLPAPDRADR